MRSLLIAVLALALLAWPAHAQPTERVLIDADLWMGSGEQQQCLILAPGELTVTAQTTAALVVASSASLSVTAMTGALDGEVFSLPISTQASTVTWPVHGGPYCWSVTADPFSHNNGLPHIALRMTHVAATP